MIASDNDFRVIRRSHVFGIELVYKETAVLYHTSMKTRVSKCWVGNAIRLDLNITRVKGGKHE